MSFYSSPPPQDREAFTIDSTGYARMTPTPARFRRDQGWRSYQFMYTVRGAGVGDIEGAPLRVREHSVCFMPPDRSHGYEPAEGVKLWQYRWIEFGGAMAPGLLKMFGLDGLPCVHDCREAWPAVEEVVHALETGGNAALHEAAALFLRVLAIVERRYRPERARVPVVHQLDLAVKRYVADHLVEEISLRDVARAVRSSPHHLIRVFKRNNGKTPMAYLRQLRAERAKSLLYHGGLSVKEVGQRVGYPVVQHFSRMFRQETGLSPRAYLRTQFRKA